MLWLSETCERTADPSYSCFYRVWEQLQDSELPPPQEEMAKWEAQFNQMMSSQREELDLDYGGMMQNAWDSMGQDFSTEPPMQFDDEGIPIIRSYVFGGCHPVRLPLTVPLTAVVTATRSEGQQVS